MNELIQTVSELKDENKELQETMKDKELRLKDYDTIKEKEIESLKQIQTINSKTQQQNYQNELDNYINHIDQLSNQI